MNVPDIFVKLIFSRMLCWVLGLTRRNGQQIVIDGGIVVTILEIGGASVRVGVEARRKTTIVRNDIRRLQEDLTNSDK